ncbi:terminase [Corynebacterium poyangense]|uniref:Terminase n=2 Tax=Corynebacterium poyangense TaxID=2684405 RepID=A0A7H0SSH7_9CORY|nr:terminase [Corynebacterium poyangense]
MPWQQHCLDIIGEVDETGVYRWPIVIISVPRQSGKTTMTMAVALHRILTGRGRKVWHTAQTGQDARSKWLELVDVAMASSWRSLLKSRKTNGAESLEIPRLLSKFSPHPPTEESLHGEQSDLNIIDEAWAFDDAQGEALMQAIVPTQSTRDGAQTILVSTMGTAKSTWFHGLVDKARAGVEDMAIIEWGIGPDDDPTDLDTVAACHPAYGHTVTMRALQRAAAQLGPAQFARAYGNRPTGSTERLIPTEAWQTAASTDPIPENEPVAFAAAVDWNRSETAIAAAAVVDDIPMIEIVDVRPGTSWAAPRLRQLAATHKATAICVDNFGPSTALHDELTRGGTDVLPLKTRDVTGACAEFYDRVLGDIDTDGIRHPRIKIRPNPNLDIAAEIVTRRRTGDAWAWSRRETTGSAGTIAPLEAATLAMFASLHQPPPPVEPGVF